MPQCSAVCVGCGIQEWSAPAARGDRSRPAPGGLPHSEDDFQDFKFFRTNELFLFSHVFPENKNIKYFHYRTIAIERRNSFLNLYIKYYSVVVDISIYIFFDFKILGIYVKVTNESVYNKLMII